MAEDIDRRGKPAGKRAPLPRRPPSIGPVEVNFFPYLSIQLPLSFRASTSGVGDYSLYRPAWKVRALSRGRPGEGYTCARARGTTPPRVDRQGGGCFGLTIDSCDASSAWSARTAT